MVDDTGELTPPFFSMQPNDTTPWVEITSIHTQLPTNLRPDDRLYYRVFATRVKSSSPDCEFLLHDPLRYMLVNPGELVNLPGWPDESKLTDPDERAAAVAARLNFEEEDDSRSLRNHPRFHITTFLSNHHRRLTKWHASVLAIAGADGLHLMVYKESGQGEADFS